MLKTVILAQTGYLVGQYIVVVDGAGVDPQQRAKIPPLPLFGSKKYKGLNMLPTLASDFLYRGKDKLMKKIVISLAVIAAIGILTGPEEYRAS